MTILFTLILILLFLNPNIIANQVLDSINLWIKILIPSLYPSLICIDIISNSKLLTKITNFIHPLFKKIFNINSSYSTFIIILSYICGAPASTKLILNAKNNNKISSFEAENLIYCFSNLSLPFTIFILKDYKLILVYYFCSILISALLMNIINKKQEINQLPQNNQIDFISIFLSSIKKNIELMLNILGIVMFFRIIINLIFSNNFIGYTYIEILGGITSTNNKFIILSSLGFLGISIHLQILSIYKVKYYKLLLIRLIYLILGFVFLLNI